MKKGLLKRKFERYPHFSNLIKYIYYKISGNDLIEKKVSYGELNEYKKIYVIRPNSEDGIQGLMSLLIQTLRKLDYAERKGLTPFVDFYNYKTQYYDGHTNSWENFFNQVSSLTLNEVYHSKNVILSGASLNVREDMSLFKDTIFFNDNLAKRGNSIISKYIKLSEDAENLLSNELEAIDIHECLGVYLRGTDYVKLKPSGEYRQPEIKDVIFKIDEFLKKYSINHIFLVTEDYYYYEILKKRYKDQLIIVSYDSFIKNYDGKDYLSKSNVLNEDKKERGIEYLIKIILLSKCKYFISSITFGSIAAYAFNGNRYDDKYIFNLGYYD